MSTQRSGPVQTPLTPQAHAAGLNGINLRFALAPVPEAMAATQSLAAGLVRDPIAGLTEIAPGLVSVLVQFDPLISSRSEIAREMMRRAGLIVSHRPGFPDPLRKWTIPVAFGDANGPQLEEVACAVGVSASAAVAEVCAADLRVLAVGFAPGQPYIGLMPDAWNLPRQSELTPNVPAGAVVAAVRQLVLFGAPSATGWRMIGRSAFRTFQQDRAEPILLKPGDAIAFAAISANELAGLEAEPGGLGGATCEILR